MTVLQLLTAKAQHRAADRLIQAIRCQRKSNRQLAWVATKKTTANGLRFAELFQQRARHWQALAFQAAQAITPAVGADKRAQVGFMEPCQHALGFKKLLEVAQGHVAAGMGIERVTLANSLGIQAIHLALVALVHMRIGLIEQMPPTVVGKALDPTFERQRQTCGNIA